MMYKFMMIVALLLVAPMVAQADSDPAVMAKKAEKTISSLGDDAISALKSTASTDKRQEEFTRILNNHFDMKRIAQFVMGRYWRAAKDAEKKEYTSLFNDYVIGVYSNRFEEYSGQVFEVQGSKPAGRSDVIVNSLIISPSGQPPVKVDWRLRDNKIIDVIVEGVSMSVSQRSEFNSIIQRNNGQVSALIDHLKKY